MTLPSYTQQRALLCLMVNYVLSVITLNLMLHNMTGKSFSTAQPMLLLPLVPLVAYHLIGVSPEIERAIPMVITVAAWVIFVTKMAVLSKQWCDFSGKYFWTIKKE